MKLFTEVIIIILEMVLLLSVMFSMGTLTLAQIHPFSEEAINRINNKAATWTAGRNFQEDDYNKFKKIANGSSPVFHNVEDSFTLNPHNESEHVPEYFDSRDIWSYCKSIREIADQSHCGSCWAVSVTSAITDRICIHSNQQQEVYVSADDLISCCLYCPTYGPGYGCEGGNTYKAWHYWKKFGITTGGSYHSRNGCKTYSLRPCGSEGNECEKVYRKKRWLCKQQCYNSSLSYDDSLTFGKDLVHVNTEKQIQLEILTNGPVVASFTVYEDFAHYISGIYQATTDEVTGHHAIKIIGWGTTNGVPYWLCANSWDTDWGDNGFFKILRGENHCKIEHMVVAALPSKY